MRRSLCCRLGLLCLPLLGFSSLAAAGPGNPASPDSSARRWKINTHLFAANMALADALHDGRVTIPPFGDFPVSASALRALKAAPAAYRAGVLAPDLFPDMWVGGWFIHSDLSDGPDGWMADNWMRHLWSRAKAWEDPGERDKVLAFAYGFLTHGAGDIFAHTYVNQLADGAWITFTGPARSTAVKHVVLEGYVGSRTPTTDLTLDVWPRFVANVLIRDPSARAHSVGAVHYQRFLAIYDWLGPQIERAEKQMDNNVSSQAPYWAKCAANAVACAKKEQMETWRLDINRGFRALVDSSQTLGEQLMDHRPTAGVDAMTGWMSEWIPKMFGAHAIGEGTAALAEFLQWVGDPLAPINAAVMAEVTRFFQDRFPLYYDLYESVKDPAFQMDQVGFPSGTRLRVDQDMGIAPGSAGSFNWRAFEPIYNSVVLSKLVLLDRDGLNELAKRAGLIEQLFQPGENANLMLGVFRSMTQSYQWTGEIVRADTGATATKFGICGPEAVGALPMEAVCGVRQPPTGARASGAVRQSPGGFTLWGHPEAREKIFRRIFKGYGPGPGSASFTDVADLGPAAAGVRTGARGLRAASEQMELMRETVALMRGKVTGVATAAATPQATPTPTPTPTAAPVRPTAGARTQARPKTPPPTAPNPATAVATPVTDWGRQCCGRDVAALRGALSAIQASSRSFLSPAVLGALSRRSNVLQLDAYVAQLNGALSAFEQTRDAQAATAALDVVSNQVEVLARLLGGAQ